MLMICNNLRDKKNNNNKKNIDCCFRQTELSWCRRWILILQQRGLRGRYDLFYGRYNNNIIMMMYTNGRRV